jgi:hypothetical protein
VITFFKLVVCVILYKGVSLRVTRDAEFTHVNNGTR